MGRDERLRDAYIKVEERLAKLREQVRATPLTALPEKPISMELVKEYSAWSRMWQTLLEAQQSGDPSRIDEAIADAEAVR